MFYLILQSLYLALPAYTANMAPVIFAKLGWLKFANQPIDNGKKIGKNFIFGKNKTWRGLISGVIVAVIISLIQAGLYYNIFFQNLSLFDYSKYWLIFGFLAGLGAILGDLIKSFFKRRVNIVSGKPWPIFDQLDFIAGFLLFTYWLAKPSLEIIIIIFILTLVLHPLTNILGYLLKIKRVWW